MENMYLDFDVGGELIDLEMLFRVKDMYVKTLNNKKIILEFYDDL